MIGRIAHLRLGCGLWLLGGAGADLGKSRRDRFCRFLALNALGDVSPGPLVIANRAHTRAFGSVLPDVAKGYRWWRGPTWI